MKPADLLSTFESAGICINLSADGQRLSVPAGVLTDAQREQLRQHKAAIISHLKKQQPSSNEMAEPAPTSPVPTDWQAVRDAYYSHHYGCPTCICAGRGYGLRCGTGASLWAAYGAINPPFAGR
ncbi:MAG: hypothetical protein KIG95_08675 [Comamonas sp.]|nr:hypothetical protein [Comamonas sp.]